MKVETEEGFRAVISNKKLRRKMRTFILFQVRGDYLRFINRRFIVNGEEMYGIYVKKGDKLKTRDGEVIIKDKFMVRCFSSIYNLKVDSIKNGYFLLGNIINYM